MKSRSKSTDLGVEVKNTCLLMTMGVVLVALQACSWVKPTTNSHKVLLAKKTEVGACTKLGSTTSKTLNKVVLVKRNEEKVFNELVVLAKNEAAIMGGDTIVPEEKKQDGATIFGVYRCR